MGEFAFGISVKWGGGIQWLATRGCGYTICMIRPEMDGDNVADLFGVCFAGTPYTDLEPKEIDDSGDRGSIMLAVVDGVVVGHAAVWDKGGIWALTAVCVHPSYRGMGLGGRLLECLKERYSPIVGFALEGVQEFYKKCGFRVIDDGVVAWGIVDMELLRDIIDREGTW